MPTNLFSKNARKRSDVNKAPLAATIPNDEAILAARAVSRRQVDFELVGLEVRNQTKTKCYTRSFVSIAEKYPHHDFLIKQLLHGAALDIGNRLVAYSNHQQCYYAIEEFIDYLNSRGQPHQNVIRSVVDIDFQTTRNFVAFLLQFFPGRPENRRRYGRVRGVVNKLKVKYESNPYVGKAIVWALAPGNLDRPSESYSDEVFNQLIEACLTDVKFIMKMMTDYSYQATAAKQIDSNLQYTVKRDGTISGMSRDESNRLCSALVAAEYPHWPFFESLDRSLEILSVEWRATLARDDKVNRDLFRAITSMRIVQDIKSQTSGEMRSVDLQVGTRAYFSQFSFTFQTIVPFILFVQINTGWNLEAVLNLSDDLDSHLGEDLIDAEQYVLIYSTKWRTEDVLYCRSNKLHPYSVYNVLRFVQKQIQRLKKSQYYCSGYLWQCIMSKSSWGKLRCLTMPVDSKNFTHASRDFVSRHGINIQNNTKSPAVESRRIRTTFVTKRREQGLSLESVSKMMGHESVETTDVHYDRDLGSTNVRNRKLRQLQVGWENDFRNYGVRLSTSVSLAQLRQAIGTSAEASVVSKAAVELNIDNKTVIHLLSASGQTYIAACLDSKAPSWPDAKSFVPLGEKCAYFNRCCMCKQAVLFKESLPFVARRVVDLSRLKTRINSFEWSTNYGEEMTAWEQILESWNPSSDVEEAKKNATDPQYALPLTMRGLQ